MSYYSKHELACIPIAAVHINMSTTCTRTSRFCMDELTRQRVAVNIQCYLFIQNMTQFSIATYNITTLQILQGIQGMWQFSPNFKLRLNVKCLCSYEWSWTPHSYE